MCSVGSSPGYYLKMVRQNISLLCYSMLQRIFIRKTIKGEKWELNQMLLVIQGNSGVQIYW